MLFNSLHFLIFFPVIVLLYYLTKSKYRWILLLAASYYFYMVWRVEYIFLILFSTLIDYWAGLQMGRRDTRRKRLPFLLMSLCSNLGLLGFFKYYYFVNDSIRWSLALFDSGYNYPVFDLLLPVGISFYTFQTLSYSIEVYWGTQKPEKHLGNFALYVSFFPQLVAGPIERFSNLGTQLKEHHRFSWDNLRNGLRLMLYGLFTKMVVADNLSVYVDKFYENPSTYEIGYAWVATLFYSLQIYGDFYGYSLIAIGAALILGIKIMDNFQNPYFALSIHEFWRRWHISLSTWFRDYLYVPLGGNRVRKRRWVINIILVFTISGLWHGAAWTFIVWGSIHGLLYLSEEVFGKVKKMPSWLKLVMVIKTLIIVNIAWVFFRSPDFDTAGQTIYQLFIPGLGSDQLAVDILVWVIITVFIVSDFLLYNSRFDRWIESKPLLVRWASYAILLYGILAFAGVENKPFIYFQF